YQKSWRLDCRVMRWYAAASVMKHHNFSAYLPLRSIQFNNIDASRQILRRYGNRRGIHFGTKDLSAPCIKHRELCALCNRAFELDVKYVIGRIREEAHMSFG